MPFYRFHIDTPLSESAASERIQKFTRPHRAFREWIAFNVTMFLHPLVTVFMIIWFSGLGYGIVKLWVHRNEAVPFAILVPAAMFLFGVALMLVCFIPEAIKAKRLLESAVDK